MSATPIMAYAKLNARLRPMDRGGLYEDPLQEALEADGFAEVVGGGTMLQESGEVDYCGIDIDLRDVERGVPMICATLDALAAAGNQQGFRKQVCAWGLHGKILRCW